MLSFIFDPSTNPADCMKTLPLGDWQIFTLVRTIPEVDGSIFLNVLAVVRWVPELDVPTLTGVNLTLLIICGAEEDEIDFVGVVAATDVFIMFGGLRNTVAPAPSVEIIVLFVLVTVTGVKFAVLVFNIILEGKLFIMVDPPDVEVVDVMVTELVGDDAMIKAELLRIELFVVF